MIRRVEADDWELLRDIRLRALFEDPDAFLATHARELVARVVDWARERGAERVSLSVEGHNARAARLYERCGFTETEGPVDLPYEPNDGNRFFVLAL